MLPQIPENFYSILLVIGLFLFGYSFYLYLDFIEVNKTATISYSKIDRIIDSIRFENKMQIVKSNRMVQNLSERNDLRFPPSIDDSTFIDNSYKIGANNKGFKDSILVLYIDYLQKTSSRANQLSYLKSEKKIFADEINEFKTKSIACYMLVFLGVLFFLPGYYGIYRQQYIKDKISEYQQRSLQAAHIRCQSCGKVFSSMVKYGREQDGTDSSSFCNSCYDKGKFTEPDISFAEIKRRALTSAERTKKENRLLAKTIENLERWRPDNYQEPNY